MSEEKNEDQSTPKAKVKPGPRSLERKTKGISAQKFIAECDRQEAQLFAQRGYGGYIDTEELNTLRKIKDDAKARLPKDAQPK